MEVKLAKHAGVCYGVAKALQTVNTLLEQRKPGEKIYTYGPLIHNKNVVARLERSGVTVLNDLNGEIDGTVIIRAHGVPPEIFSLLNRRGIPYIDCTCHDVTKTHQIAENCVREGRRVIIAGSAEHPEVIGTAGFAGSDVIIVESEAELDALQLDTEAKYSLMAQTTFSKEKFNAISDKLCRMKLNVTVYDTICNATAKRQEAAKELATQVDCMLVLGDAQSSNTTKLYEICKKQCKNSFLIETITELELNIFTNDDRIGITAGASTPPDIIKEAYSKMSEFEENKNPNTQSFEEMLDDSLVTLYTGNVVKGTVINVSNGEVFVNLGYKSDGIIPKGEFSEDPSVEPASMVKTGDEIEVFVVRVNDGDGNVLLSKKKVDSQRNYDDLEVAFNENQPIPGKIIDVVKGGLIALINGVRVFVPSSQISNRYVEDLTQFKGKEFNFSIIEFDKSKRRFVAGRKALAAQEQREKKEKVFASLEAGARVDGVVSRVVDFGAFVDLGGVDGLIHISELSWGRVKRVKDVLSEGDNVTVTVLELDKEKGKISLSLKDINNDPWRSVAEKYPIGRIISGKVVRMVPFGAFVELEEGVDGLIHISQISTKHVVKPEDELRIGQIVDVKVTDIDMESKRISLSKKEVDKLDEEEEVSGVVEEPAGDVESGEVTE